MVFDAVVQPTDDEVADAKFGLERPDHDAYATEDITDGFSAYRPPSRVTVSQGAAETLKIAQPGRDAQYWSPVETPYMVEPLDMLASRYHEAIVFVGPARSGKTMALLDGWLSHVVANDPGDMLVIQMSREKAQEFSRTRIDRAITHSPKLAALIVPGQGDSTHNKEFRNGMHLHIGWPTPSQVASSDYRYAVATDYDRIDGDIGGEGALFGLLLKRVTTFMSRGMAGAESSPSRPIEDPNWTPASEHEGPPCTGIIGLYNQGDRRRLYWRCPFCGARFQARPGLDLFNLPGDEQLIEIARTVDIEAFAQDHARVICPRCQAHIDPTYKMAMNLDGRWLPDGMWFDSQDRLDGPLPTAKIASYWLGGVSAVYQPWASLISRHLRGLREFALTGSEKTLMNTCNTDQAMPYLSMHLREAARADHDPRSRAEPTLQRFVVPDETRFLVASVDVQGGSTARFVVQVHAIGAHLEKWLVDRYDIRDSKREGMGTEFAPIDPASHPEDWDVLTDRVVRSTYRTSVEGRELQILMTAVDTGGEDGVAPNAYAWFRRLRHAGQNGRVMLVKGASSKTAPIIRLTFVGGRAKNDPSDIPLYLLNPNLLKDTISHGLKRATPGPGYIHLPKPKHPTQNPGGWLPASFFDELQAEVRDPDGTWRQIRTRNEAFDLLAYAHAACLRLGADKVADWDTPPAWCAPLDRNALLIDVEDRRALQQNVAIPGATVVIPDTVPRPAARRRPPPGRSTYLGSR